MRKDSRSGSAATKAVIQQDRLVSRAAAAAMLDRCTRTLREMEKLGQLQPVRLSSRSTKYRLSEIQQLIQQPGGAAV